MTLQKGDKLYPKVDESLRYIVEYTVESDPSYLTDADNEVSYVASVVLKEVLITKKVKR